MAINREPRLDYMFLKLQSWILCKSFRSREGVGLFGVRDVEWMRKIVLLRAHGIDTNSDNYSALFKGYFKIIQLNTLNCVKKTGFWAGMYVILIFQIKFDVC